MNTCPNNWSIQEINEKFASDNKTLNEKNKCNTCKHMIYDNGLLMCGVVTGGMSDDH